MSIFLAEDFMYNTLAFMSDMLAYNEFRESAQKQYLELGLIFCPALKSNVSFTSQGFNHIIYKKGRTERDRTSQVMRFKLIGRAFGLISLTTTIQEYEESLQVCSIKRKKRKMLVEKRIRYWGLIAIMDERKIKVILRKVGNGNLHFWSIIPAWVTNKTRDEKFIKTMKGDPELD